jgi:hypothetical protein
MGDTCNSDMLAPIAMDADVIIHEATNAWIKDQVTSPLLPFLPKIDCARADCFDPVVISSMHSLFSNLSNTCSNCSTQCLDQDALHCTSAPFFRSIMELSLILLLLHHVCLYALGLFQIPHRDGPRERDPQGEGQSA